MDYMYYKFVGGKYFRTQDEVSFQALNESNIWEQDDLIFYLYFDAGVRYEKIEDEEILNKLSSFPEISLGEIKK